MTPALPPHLQDLEPLRQMLASVVGDGLALGLTWAAIVVAVTVYEGWAERRRRPR